MQDMEHYRTYEQRRYEYQIRTSMRQIRTREEPFAMKLMMTNYELYQKDICDLMMMKFENSY